MAEVFAPLPNLLAICWQWMRWCVPLCAAMAKVAKRTGTIDLIEDRAFYLMNLQIREDFKK